MNPFEWSEADEIVSHIATPEALGWFEASAVILSIMGTPAELGHQVFDNRVEALVLKSGGRL